MSTCKKLDSGIHIVLSFSDGESYVFSAVGSAVDGITLHAVTSPLKLGMCKSMKEFISKLKSAITFENYDEEGEDGITMRPAFELSSEFTSGKTKMLRKLKSIISVDDIVEIRVVYVDGDFYHKEAVYERKTGKYSEHEEGMMRTELKYYESLNIYWDFSNSDIFSDTDMMSEDGQTIDSEGNELNPDCGDAEINDDPFYRYKELLSCAKKMVPELIRQTIEDIKLDIEMFDDDVDKEQLEDLRNIDYMTFGEHDLLLFMRDWDMLEVVCEEVYGDLIKGDLAILLAYEREINNYLDDEG